MSELKRWLTIVVQGLLFALALLAAVWRLSPAWAAFVVVGVLVPLSAGGLLSMGRLTSTLFPLFLAAALVLPAGLLAGLEKLAAIEARMGDVGIHPDIAGYSDLGHAFDLRSSVLAALCSCRSTISRPAR